jgi:hypothetical protein
MRSASGSGGKTFLTPARCSSALRVAGESDGALAWEHFSPTPVDFSLRNRDIYAILWANPEQVLRGEVRCPSEGLLVYFYEGRTIRGVRWVTWALLIQLAALTLSAVVTVALVELLGPSVNYPGPAFLFAVSIEIAAVCGLVIAQIVALVFYLVGFQGIHAGRHEYGPAQDRMMDRALVFLVLAIVMGVAQGFSPFAAIWGVLSGVPTDVATYAYVGSLALQSTAALFAGLTLMSSVSVFADPSQRARLLIGIILGAVGAAAGTVILLVAELLEGTPSAVETVVASTLAGQGTCAISLIVFFLVYREVHHKLEAGLIPPALPRPPIFWPYYYPAYGYPAPASQAPPAAPASPPAHPP